MPGLFTHKEESVWLEGVSHGEGNRVWGWRVSGARLLKAM